MTQKRRNDAVTTWRAAPLWYKDALIYQLHVRAYCDSNGDGVGDFRGLITRLDYLQDLGITTIWLLPFYPSPLRDDGYDIADYTDVHRLYGTLADFKLFLHEAHRRGLYVITELVLNHTSDQHPWFQRARRAPPGSVGRDFYVWSDTTDKYQDARIIFKDFETSNWAWDPVARAHYWHRFYSHQPDLNFDNPAVHQALFGVVDFWFGMGIDGLRLDAVPYLYEREGTNCENLPETHAFLRDLRRHVDERFPNRMLLAEANQWPEDAVAYFGQGDECHMAFHFPLMPRLFMAIRMEDRFPVLDILHQTPPIPPTSQWAIFLRNHDELTLEMVTDEDRDYMYRVYAQDHQARINLGIRRRLAPLLENHRGKIELMNGLLLSLPGTPIVYYGDEIGMGDNIYLGDRNGVRTPMQWSAERNAGFSRANPQRLYLPVIIDPEYHYETLNVEAQQNNPHSLLWWLKRLIALRKRYRAFGRGGLEFLAPDNPKVLAFLRRYPNGGIDVAATESVLVVANLSRFVQHVELDLGQLKGFVPVEMMGRTKMPVIGDRPYSLTLGPYAFYWLSLEPERRPVGPRSGEEMPLPTLQVTGDWKALLRGRGRQALEEVLPAYLQRCSWFLGRSRPLSATHIKEVIALPIVSPSALLTLVQVECTEGDPEMYLVLLAHAGEREAEDVQARRPEAIVCRVEIKPADADAATSIGVLYDPLVDRTFAQGLLEALRRRRHFKGHNGEVVATSLPAFAPLSDKDGSALEPALLRGEHRHTSVVFGDRFILKVFRRLHEGVNPELEVGRFFAERKTFPHAPPLAGALEHRPTGGEPLTLAVLHGFVPNQGDGWRYTFDALGRYFDQALTAREGARALPLPQQSFLDLAAVELPRVAQDTIGPFLEAARLLGQRTGEMHVALAGDPGDPAFAPEPFTTMYQRSLYQGVRTAARRALEALRRRLPQLSEEEQALASRMLSLEPELLKRLHGIFERKIVGQRIRCHVDYDLRQVLWTGKDWVIIDFEGDAGRPISERRQKRSPLRDVASMIRSFHYAALSALTRGTLRREDQLTLQPWVRFWHQWVAAAFLKAYLEVATQQSFLPSNREELGVLLDFFLLKRAVNELRHELSHHPDRVTVPLHGLLHLLEGGE